MRNSLQSPQRRHWLALAGCGLATFGGAALGQSPNGWSRITSAARGQKLAFHTAPRNEPLNAFLQWATTAMQEQYGVQVQHVRMETADSLKRIQTEVAEEQTRGSVDLLTLSGGHLAQALQRGLLFGPIDSNLPNLSLLDTANKPALLRDGATVFNGMVVPWSLSQLTFWMDGRRFEKTPRDALELLSLARSAPGSFSYPRPPDPLGQLFLQQLLWSLASQRAALEQPPANATAREEAWQRVWGYLDALHPAMWRQGKEMPQNNDAMRQLMFSGELAWGLSLQPTEALQEMAIRRLSPRTRVFQFAEGTLAQSQVVGIAVNARAKASALCLAHLLLSPEAQARKAAPATWGEQHVLNMAVLSEAQRNGFKPWPADVPPLSAAAALPLPHPGWLAGMEETWNRRYFQR